MRPILIPLLVSLASTCALTACDATAADEPASSRSTPTATAHRGAPRRKDGWWEFSSVTSTGRTVGTQNLCVTAATEAVFSSFDQITQERLIGTKCSKAEFTQESGAWKFDTACDTGIPAAIGGGIVTSVGTLSGDLTSKYSIELTVKQGGETNHGKITAAWKGRCPAQRKAGDLEVNGVLQTNILAD
jgi:hypothetical protein